MLCSKQQQQKIFHRTSTIDRSKTEKFISFSIINCCHSEHPDQLFNQIDIIFNYHHCAKHQTKTKNKKTETKISFFLMNLSSLYPWIDNWLLFVVVCHCQIIINNINIIIIIHHPSIIINKISWKKISSEFMATNCFHLHHHHHNHIQLNTNKWYILNFSKKISIVFMVCLCVCVISWWW